MHRVPLSRDPLRRVLCLGAHCDDIEIGCAGTLLKLSAAPGLTVDWVVFSSSPAREAETRRAAAELLSAAAEVNLSFMSFADGNLPGYFTEVKSAFSQLKALPSPDLILTHHRGDLHQDHRLIGDLTWQTFRDHLIWEYEIPKYDGDIGRPNVYVPLDETTMDKKISALLKHYESQRNKHWFSAETFTALAKLRGMETGIRGGFAEAFYSTKTIMAL